MFGPHDYSWVTSEHHCQPHNEIGSGSAGTVYKAVHPSTGQFIAIKKMDRAPLQRNDQALHSFQREVDMFCRLNHPGIIRLLGVQMEPACHLLIMEHAECELAAEMEDGALPEATCRFYFRQIVRSVGYCHSQGICHRDLKLENVLLMKDCATVKVTDFGMGKNFQMNSGPKTHEVGSFAYMSPEVVGGLGEYQVMLFAMSTCTYPFGFQKSSRERNASLQDERRIRRAIMSGRMVFEPDAFPRGAQQVPVSAGLQDLIRKIFVVDPTKRATIAEILEHSWLQERTGEEEYWQMMTPQASQYPSGSPPRVDPAAVAAMHAAHAARHAGAAAAAAPEPDLELVLAPAPAPQTWQWEATKFAAGAAGAAPMVVPLAAAGGTAIRSRMTSSVELPVTSPPIGAASGGTVGLEGYYGSHLPTCSLESQSTVEMIDTQRSAGDGEVVTAEDMAQEGWVGAQYDWAAAPVYAPQDSAGGSFDFDGGQQGDFFDREDDEVGF